MKNQKTQKNKAIVFDFNRTIFNPETGALYDGAWHILEFAYQFFDLFLVSKIEEGRENMLRRLKIDKFFKSVHFVPEKTQALFENILIGYSKEKSFVIGDVVSKEITIGNMISCKTVWIRQGKFKDHFPILSHEIPNHTIHSLEELRDII